MYSGISGLKNFQTKLDVIGNNISNVNTHGFKKGRVVFKDLISQTQSGASGPNGITGGVNAKQVGLGSQLAAIDTIHGTGALQSTGRTLDLALAGEGFFVVGELGAVADDEIPVLDGFKSINYTRAGNFYMDQNGTLVNSEGKILVGMPADEGTVATYDADGQPEYTPIFGADDELVSATADAAAALDNPVGAIVIPTDAQSMSIGIDGQVTYVSAAGTLMYAGQLVTAKFSNPEGLTKEGGNYYQYSANSGLPGFGAAGNNGLGKIESGFLEMSNVDLSEEFTEMIVAQRGFQANSRIITTSDEILQELVNLKR